MTENTINVTKRSGKLEPIDLAKIQKLTRWACEGITGVSPSEVEIRSQIQFYDRITTKDIHESLINSAAGLINEETPNYQYVAGRMINFALRKEVYGQYEPPRLYDHIRRVIDTTQLYDSRLLSMYTESEWDQIDQMIDHDRDLDLTYIAMEQFRGKYLIRNRKTNQYVETPQMAYALIAAVLFADYPRDTRLSFVRQFYDATSLHYITLATPILGGVRTPERQYSSCVLIESDDTLDSITATTTAVVKYVSSRAGIGINGGRIRSKGSAVRGGLKTHTGLVPYYKLFQSAIGSCSQGGIRKGSGTVFYPAWHLDFDELIVLKNGRGIEENRVRNLDYGVQLNRVMYERLMDDGYITLFSPDEVPELYEAFFSDVDLFRQLYEQAESNPNLRKKRVKALDLFSTLLSQRKETGRIYIQHVDHCNTHGSFDPTVAPIRQSNLCVEITLPTKPLYLDDPDAEIATCILAAINWGKIREPSEFEKYCDLAVRALNVIIDIQEYPLTQARNAALNRRTIGVGVVNFAYWMAKHGFFYDDVSDQALVEIDRWAQYWSYYLIKASMNLASEKQTIPPKFNETRYSKSVFPIDTYAKAVDDIVPPVFYVDWDELRQNVAHQGMMNSTLMALMPVETSSQVANATNGIDPPRALVSSKGSKDGVFGQVVPEIRKLKNKYSFVFDQKSPQGYLKIMAVLQKYIDQAISVNTSYNNEHYENAELPMSTMIEDLVFAYNLGTKNLYYHNTGDGAGEINVANISTASSTEETAFVEDESCSACVL